MMLILALLKLSLILIASPAATAAVEIFGVKPGCNTTCGNLTVPYPFGIGVECAANSRLFVTCKTSYTPSRTDIRTGNLEIVSITESEKHIKNNVGFTCYNQYGNVTGSSPASTTLDVEGSYTFSWKRNKFISVECNTVALIKGIDEKRYTSGCISLCRDKEGILNGSCSGMGCCQASISKGLSYFNASINRSYDIGDEGEDWNFKNVVTHFLPTQTNSIFNYPISLIPTSSAKQENMFLGCLIG